MPIRITVNTDEVVALLNKIKSNVPKALEAAGEVYLIDAAQRIAHGDSSWAAWSKPYAKWSAKHPHQMMWLHGTLLRSLTKGDSNNVFEFEGNDSLLIGSNVRYARAQQFGYPARNLPARPYFALDDEDLNKKAAAAFVKYLVK